MFLCKILSDADLIELYKNATVMVAPLLNGRLLIGNMIEQEDCVIVMYPMYINFYVDDDGKNLYNFIGINPASPDKYSILNKHDFLTINYPYESISKDYVTLVNSKFKGSNIQTSSTVH